MRVCEAVGIRWFAFATDRQVGGHIWSVVPMCGR